MIRPRDKPFVRPSETQVEIPPIHDQIRRTGMPANPASRNGFDLAQSSGQADRTMPTIVSFLFARSRQKRAANLPRHYVFFVHFVPSWYKCFGRISGLLPIHFGSHG